VTVVLDDDVIDVLNDARADLADAEQAADAVYERKLTLARSANPPASELLTIEGRLDAEGEGARRRPRGGRRCGAGGAGGVADVRVPLPRPQGVRGPDRRAPPTDDDHDDTRRMTGRPEALARWHTDTFTPALIAACAVDPKISPEQAEADVRRLDRRGDR
jgi:hypothetical protein